MSHELFKLIPHQKIVNKKTNKKVTFDLYQLGSFNNNWKTENIALVELEKQVEYQLNEEGKNAVILYIISGNGLIHFNQTSIEYKSGMRIDIPEGVNYLVIPTINSLFLSIQTPTEKNAQREKQQPQNDIDWLASKEWGAFIQYYDGNQNSNLRQ